MLGLFVYWDNNLIINASSYIFTAYEESIRTTWVREKTITGQLKSLKKDTGVNEFKQSLDKNDGYKIKKYDDKDYCENTKQNDSTLEDKSYEKESEEITKKFSTFRLIHEITREFYKANNIHLINEKDLLDSKIEDGEFIELTGEIIESSIISYIDTIMSIIKSYGIESLNKILDLNIMQNKIMNFSVIFNLLSNMKDILVKNGTQDLILKVGKTKSLITVNSNYFLDSNYCIYDLVHCKCTVFGKIMKITQCNKCISLIRKTCQEEYYNRLLDSIDPYLELMKDNGIVLPKKCYIELQGASINILPISIYI